MMVKVMTAMMMMTMMPVKHHGHVYDHSSKELVSGLAIVSVTATAAFVAITSPVGQKTPTTTTTVDYHYDGGGHDDDYY